MTLKRGPYAIRLRSPAYYAVTLLFRLASKCLARGRGMTYFRDFMSGLFEFQTIACEARIRPESVFLFEASDPYWGDTFLRGVEYEPEIGAVLERIRDIGYLFIDCGANYGYWSVLVSDPDFGGHTVVSIEPSPSTYVKLSANCAANGHRFLPLNRAVARASGLKLPFVEDRFHHAARIPAVEGGEPETSVSVTSVALDEVVAHWGGEGVESCVIKLDVEGFEIEAMAGAVSLLEQKDVLVIYEDHGSDQSCRVTSFFLQRGFEIFFVDGAKAGAVRVPSVQEAAARKEMPHKGYNFVAVKPGGGFAERAHQWVDGVADPPRKT